MIVKITDTGRVKELFGDWQESVVWSCLQNVMGEIYGDCGEEPRSAMAILGDFCFLAGRPDRELCAYRVERPGDFLIMVPQNREWGAVIERVWGEKARKVTRYAIKKEPGIFDLQRLERAVCSLPPEYELRMMDEELFVKTRKPAWCCDWTARYPDYQTFREHALGVVILKDGQPVSGASSYSHYQGGIEVEIDTREDYRRRGLAYICAAKLILECEKRGLYPSWDAQNLWSVALAEKLGYHYGGAYDAYEIYGYGGRD